MRLIVLEFTIGLVLAMSGVAYADETIHPLNAFSDRAKEALQGESSWRRCGDYFAVIELHGIRVVFFSFKKNSLDQVIKIPVFTQVDEIAVSVNRTLTTPLVVVREEEPGRPQYHLWLDIKNLGPALLCITSNEGTGS